MAYRHFYGAPYLQCWADGTHICVREPGGSVSRYACSLGIRVAPQVIPFRSPEAVWCLRSGGVLYVGRNDGTCSGFRESDGLLVRYGVWDFPVGRRFVQVGQCYGLPAYIDTADLSTVYVSGRSKVFLLYRPLNSDVLRLPVLGDQYARCERLTIYPEGGVFDADRSGTWVDTPRPERRDSPVQL